MPLQNENSEFNYIKITKLYVSSADRQDNSRGIYDYFIKLDREIQYVIGMEVTGYNFPTELAPTFVGGTVTSPGTNKLDFEISNGVVTTVFSATWPEKQYSYQNITVPYLSYVNVLQQILNQTIQPDATFGTGAPNEAFFFTETTPDENTRVTVTGTGVTGFRFLFDSGPNQRDSSHLAMGFNKVDTALALTVQSPSPTNLRPFRYVDINIDAAAEISPLKRIYMTENLSYGNVRNDPDITRTRLLSSQPIRVFDRFRVTLTLENGVVPPVFQGLDHEFTLTVFSLANEVYVPRWIKQIFVL